MNDEIYLKTEDGGIWEKSPHFAFLINTLIGIVLLFTFCFLFEAISVVVWFMLYLIIVVSLSLKLNQRHNMSKSTAFIKRDGRLYAIQLLYAKNISGTVLQDETLDDDIKDAMVVQSLEKEVRKRREKPESFVIALDDILEYLNNKPKKYHVLSDDKRTILDNLFMYHFENNGLAYIETKNGQYNFLILDNPEIIRKNEKNFTVSFNNEKNEKCTALFTNCYGNIIDEINKMNHWGYQRY